MRSADPTATPTRADEPSVVLEPGSVQAVVLEVDGALVDSQPLRVTAWQDTLDAYMAQYTRVTGRRQRPLDVPFSLPPELVGRLEADTAAGLLRARGARIDLGYEHLGPSEAELLEILVRHEDERFLELLRSTGAPARSGAERLLLDLRAVHVATAAVSPGRHGTDLLNGAGLADLLDACVDADDAWQYQLAGPPAPALYELALRLLHVAPGHAALIAETRAAVEAGKRAAFGRVVLVGHGVRALPPVRVMAVDGLDRITVGLLTGR